MSSESLTIEQIDSDASRWSFDDTVKICIGRSPDNDICLSHPEVSRTHCELNRDDDGWECVNLGRNGIFVDGISLERVTIKHGLVLRLSSGGPELRFRLDGAELLESSIDDDPVTLWINECRNGEESAATHLWDHYFDHILDLARSRLRRSAKRVVDEEDVALGVMDSFFRGLREQKFELSDREQLWKLLVVITTRQAIEQIQHSTRKKRGGGDVRGDSIFLRMGDTGERAGFDIFPGNEPSPELLAAVEEETDRLIGMLHDETLQAIALWKLEDWTNDEIAKKLDCTTRTVERRLADIRAIWSSAMNGAV